MKINGKKYHLRKEVKEIMIETLATILVLACIALVIVSEAHSTDYISSRDNCISEVNK